MQQSVSAKHAYAFGCLPALCWLVACHSAAGAPELNVQKAAGPAHPGKPYRIVCEISWVGAPTIYTILPARIDDIGWGRAEVATVESFLRDGANVTAQTVEIVPDAPGSYQTPAISISYLTPDIAAPPKAPEASQPASTPPELPSLKVEPFALEVRGPNVLAWALGCLGSFGLLAGCAALATWPARRRRKRKQIVPESPDSRVDFRAAQGALHEAKKCRLDGKPYEFYVALRNAAATLSHNGRGELSDTLAKRAQTVGYKGVRPTDDEMDTDYREVERMLRRTTEDTKS